MSIVVKHKGKDLMFTKGAAEQVLKLCSNWMNGDSVVAPLDDTTRQEILTYLSSKTKQGFRLLLMAYKEMPQDMEYTTETPDEDLTLLGVTAILDPLREEVPDSVESCRKAGIKVIMVTGDHKDTAQHIAGKCGIYHADQDGVVMEASEFRKLYDEAFLAQHGTRLQRYVKREEQQVGDEMESTLSPYLSEGQPLHWKEAIGPCCQKEPRHVLYGQKEKATNYQGFASGLVRGKPPQLDMWAYGVSNKYDPAKWDKETQDTVEEVRLMAMKAYLTEAFEEASKLDEELKAKAAAVSPQLSGTPDAAEAVEKLGLMIMPPADFRNDKVMAMSAKAKEAIDGGPEAAKLWRKVDEVLYKYENNERVRHGGLQVLARSLPDDKLKLVRRYMRNDEIVGVTGDGTNDAPALRNANVGLAMGSGTQVARDAAHITILDDNFASIVNAVKWGRNVFDNIRKFLQFQLTVNIVALTLTFVMACIVDGDVTKELPLNAVMLLWVNLIMDSMGALALATEKPTDALLDRPPHGKERLLSVSMMNMNLCQGAFQLVVLFILSSDAQFIKDLCGMDDGCNMFGNECCKPDVNWKSDECLIRQNTIVFNAFVFCQFWNEINCRKLKEFNVIERFFDSYMFTAVLIFTFILQFLMVEAFSLLVGTNGLNIVQWLMCVAIGFISLPVGFLARLVPIKGLEDRFGSGKDIGDDDGGDEDEEEAVVDDVDSVGVALQPSAATSP